MNAAKNTFFIVTSNPAHRFYSRTDWTGWTGYFAKKNRNVKNFGQTGQGGQGILQRKIETLNKIFSKWAGLQVFQTLQPCPLFLTIIIYIIIYIIFSIIISFIILWADRAGLFPEATLNVYTEPYRGTLGYIYRKEPCPVCPPCPQPLLELCKSQHRKNS